MGTQEIPRDVHIVCYVKTKKEESEEKWGDACTEREFFVWNRDKRQELRKSIYSWDQRFSFGTNLEQSCEIVIMTANCKMNLQLHSCAPLYSFLGDLSPSCHSVSFTDGVFSHGIQVSVSHFIDLAISLQKQNIRTPKFVLIYNCILSISTQNFRAIPHIFVGQFTDQCCSTCSTVLSTSRWLGKKSLKTNICHQVTTKGEGVTKSGIN